MTLERLEALFFAEGPSAFRYLALLLLVFGAIGAVVLGTASGPGFEIGHLWFLGLAFVPALLCIGISMAIARRHVTTVPLVVALCVLSALVFARDPSGAAEGITPYVPVLIGVWVAVILEVIATIALVSFVIYLWRKGSFR